MPQTNFEVSKKTRELEMNTTPEYKVQNKCSEGGVHGLKNHCVGAQAKIPLPLSQCRLRIRSNPGFQFQLCPLLALWP